jgi:hypothetical protein
MRRISRIRSMVIVAVVVTATAIASPKAASVPGTYWQKDACVQHKVGDLRVRWCVDAVTIAENGRMEFQCSWRLATMTALRGLQKGPDEGNRKMFITNQAGQRFDHFDTTGAAKFGGQLKWMDAITGSFIFPASPAGASVFTFHDDDNDVAIRNIRLDANTRTSKEGSRAVLGAVVSATEVEVSGSQSGLGPSSSSHYVLRREKDRVSGVKGLPKATFESFLRTLSEAPILRGRYTPRIEATDDYPSISIRVGTREGEFLFHSESQGEAHVPWAVEVKGTTYVIPSEAPAQALAMLAPYLEPRK